MVSVLQIPLQQPHRLLQRLQDCPPVDLLALARQLTAELVPRALRAGLDLGMDEAAQTPVWVAGEALLLREVLSNLIDNALRYAGAGASVTVGVQRSGTQACLSVEDSGPGIALEQQERIFQPFVRGTQARGEGLGLGLSLVKTVQGYAQQERQVLTDVTNARARVGQIQVNADDAASLAQFQQEDHAVISSSGAAPLLIDQAIAHLSGFGPEADLLRAIARFAVERDR